MLESTTALTARATSPTLPVESTPLGSGPVSAKVPIGGGSNALFGLVATECRVTLPVTVTLGSEVSVMSIVTRYQTFSRIPPPSETLLSTASLPVWSTVTSWSTSVLPASRTSRAKPFLPVASLKSASNPAPFELLNLLIRMSALSVSWHASSGSGVVASKTVSHVLPAGSGTAGEIERRCARHLPGRCPG